MPAFLDPSSETNCKHIAANRLVAGSAAQEEAVADPRTASCKNVGRKEPTQNSDKIHRELQSGMRKITN